MNSNSLENKIFDILYDGKLAWSVDKRALFTAEGLPSEGFGIYRSDTQKCLGIVGDRYCLQQNAKLAEHFIKACSEIGIETIRSGNLSGGKKVYFQGKLEDGKVGNDTLARYITGMNSHDGSTSIAFGAANTTIICQNTFYKAYKEKGMDRFRHTEKADEKITIYIKNLTELIKKESTLIENFQKLSQAPVEEESLWSLFKNVFEVDLHKNKDEYSTQKINKVTEVAEIIKTKGFDVHGKSLWGILSGITNYTTHIAPKSEDSIKYNMVGPGMELSNMTYNHLMSLISESTLELA